MILFPFLIFPLYILFFRYGVIRFSRCGDTYSVVINLFFRLPFTLLEMMLASGVSIHDVPLSTLRTIIVNPAAFLGIFRNQG
jgi:hypothetical protein